MGHIVERLWELIREHANGKPTVFAKKAEIPHSTFHAYINGRSPHTEHLVRIRDTFRVNLDWLLTGEGGKCIKEEPESPIDMGLLEDTIEVVEGWLKSEGKTLEPAKKAEVIIYVYEEYLEREEKPDIRNVGRILKLVA